jgi:hypothetical protein
MKVIFRQFLGALAAAVAMSVSVASCDAGYDLVMPDDDSSAGAKAGNGAFLELTLTVPTTSASGSSRAGSAESSLVYTEGLDNENTVNTVYLYFFDASTEKVVKMSDNKNYLAMNVHTADTQLSNPELGYSTDTGKGVTYCTGTVEMDENLKLNTKYFVYVLCNHNLKEFTASASGTYADLDFTTLSEFANSTQSMACIYTDGGYDGNVPMSSRDYSGKTCSSVTFTADNTISNPVTIQLQAERSLARITYCNTETVFPLYKDTNFSSQFAGKVKLVNREVLNNPPGWYTFRHIGSIDASTFETTPASGWSWSGTLSTSYPYVITPYSSQQTTTAMCYADNESPLKIVPTSQFYKNYNSHNNSVLEWLTWDEKTNGLEAAKSATEPTVFGLYSENVMHASAQKRGSATCVIFRAQLLLDDSDIADSDNVTTYTYGVEKRYVNGGYQYTYYYYGGKFYYLLSSISSAYSLSSLTSDNYADYGVKKFTYGFGYYIYYIRHQDSGSSSSMGAMEYAVVRNNSYDITINRVAVPPYTDDDIDELTYDDMNEDVKTVQSSVNAITTITPMSITPTAVPIGE